MDKPPTILFRHEAGPIAQSNDGKLIVYPGAVLHMECLWIRRFGTPKWAVSHSYRYGFLIESSRRIDQSPAYEYRTLMKKPESLEGARTKAKIKKGILRFQMSKIILDYEVGCRLGRLFFS